MSREFTTVLTGQTFMESPRWHDGRLWFSDLYDMQALSVNADGSDLRVEQQWDDQVAGLDWLPDGSLVAVSMIDHKVPRKSPDGTVSVYADLGGKFKGWGNEIIVDKQGRAWVGHFGFDLMAGEQVASTSIWRIDSDGSVHEAASDMWFPNGMAFTKSGELLVDESHGNRTTAFTVEADGTLSGRREWARYGDVPTATDFPEVCAQTVLAADGCSIDSEGALWIADYLHGRAVRVREGGEILEEIVPGDGTFACVLGGEDGRTLFLCLAPGFDRDTALATRPGRIVAVKVDVPAA